MCFPTQRRKPARTSSAPRAYAAATGLHRVPGPNAAGSTASKPAGALPTSFPFLEHYRITGGHLAYLERLLDWAQAARGGRRLVDMPVSADLEERMYPEAFALYRRALGEIAQRREASAALRPPWRPSA